MDQKIPFTSYDFWAYLSAGFLLLFVIDYVADLSLLNRDKWTIIQSIIALSSAYTVGQLVASASSFFLEKILVGSVLGYPRNTLFGQHEACRLIRFFLPGYFKALPDEVKKLILEKASTKGINASGEALFVLAFTEVKSIPSVASRLDNFLNLYGFCRNVSLVAFLDSGLLYWSYRCGDGPLENLNWAIAALTLGFGLTLRYLKFFRQYAWEVFTSYSYNIVK